jgi:hypothetical protein
VSARVGAKRSSPGQTRPAVHARELGRRGRCARGGLLVFRYIGRAEFESHAAWRTPVITAGRVEAPDPGRYAWFNDTQLVGKGMLDLGAGTQSHELDALR